MDLVKLSKGSLTMYNYYRTASEDSSRLEERATKEWSRLAGEPVQVEEVGGTLYAFGSELACLRLWSKMGVGKAQYSSARKSWFWRK